VATGGGGDAVNCTVTVPMPVKAAAIECGSSTFPGPNCAEIPAGRMPLAASVVNASATRAATSSGASSNESAASGSRLVT
jgi:hypothetical protein